MRLFFGKVEQVVCMYFMSAWDVDTVVVGVVAGICGWWSYEERRGGGLSEAKRGVDGRKSVN